MLVLLALASCQRSADSKGGEADYPTDPALDPNAPPSLALETPEAAAFLGDGPTSVAGEAVKMDQVTVNGLPAALAAGRFTADLDLPVGVTTLEVEGIDASGGVHTSGWSVLAGSFAEPEGQVAGALRLQIGAETFAALGPLLGGMLDPAALTAQVTSLNPVLDTPEARLDLTGVSFEPATIAITPAAGELRVEVSIPSFVLGLDATVYDALPFGIDLELAPELRADEVSIRTTIALRPDGAGAVDATVGPIEAELIGFDLDTGILELVDWLFLDDQDLADTVEAQLAGLGAQLEPSLDQALGALALDLQAELLGAELSVASSVDDVVVDPLGLVLDLAMTLDVSAPTPDVPGHLTFPAPPLPSSDAVAVQVSDAFMNRALFELWAGGALDMELPLDGEAAAILFLFGGKDTGTLSLRAGLPPVWIGRDGAARLQMGELALTVDTPGGEYGERVELVVAIDAAAVIEVTPEAAGVVLSAAGVKMRAVGASAEDPALREALPGIAAAFGLGIGAINEQLSFPVADLFGPDASLPPLVFERDPSDLGTLVELPIEDLLVLLGLGSPSTTTGSGTTTGGTGTTTTGTTTGGLSVAVPGSAVVTSGDNDIAANGAVGWICAGDDIVALGDGGVWYVDDNGEVSIEGTGHTVYVVGGGAVVLESPGNTVHADADADVEDNDGTNVVTVYDPLTFDLSGAPSPGC
jgi:hypothetical protein